jgi:Mg/Co/Ni transporter MgtE
VATEKDMHKVIIGLMVIFFLGDPSMQTLAWLGDMTTYIVAAAIALVTIPFVVSQLDG